METDTSGNSIVSATEHIRRHLGAIGGNYMAPSIRLRARGIRGAHDHAPTRVMSKILAGASVSPVDQTDDSGAANVTSITAAQRATSQTLGACRWTIEMTQSAFRQAHAGIKPRLVEKGISNGLIREDFEKSENGR